MKKIILGALVVVMLLICGQLDVYTVEATATENSAVCKDVHGQLVTLTECRTCDGERIMLEDVQSGHTYKVTIDTCGTWSSEDDVIVRVRER